MEESLECSNNGQERCPAAGSVKSSKREGSVLTRVIHRQLALSPFPWAACWRRTVQRRKKKVRAET